MSWRTWVGLRRGQLVGAQSIEEEECYVEEEECYARSYWNLSFRKRDVRKVGFDIEKALHHVTRPLKPTRL